MSMYLNFFIRTKSGFIPMQSYCRTSEMMSLFYQDIAPYEKVRALSVADFEVAIAAADAKIKEYHGSIEKCEQNIQLIASMNGSIEEKLEYIDSYQDSITEVKEHISELNEVHGALMFMHDFVDEMALNMKYESDRYPYVDPNKIIYLGIEAPAIPTEEDIVGE